MAPLFTNNSCIPFLERHAPCIIGNYVVYSVNASSARDISRTIWFATYFNIRLVIKNTGHDYNGKSVGAGALGIWTRHLQSFQVLDYTSFNYTGKAIKVGAGVNVIEVYREAHSQALAVVGGQVRTVGYAGGYTQGGGHSPLTSKYGLAAQQVLEWEVVDGLGQVRRATPSNHADLFWALCGGGGGTYGVVTSMTSKAFADGPVVGATLSFTSDNTSQAAYYDAISVFHSSLSQITTAGAVAVWFFTNSTFALSPLTAPGLRPEQAHYLLRPLLSRLESLSISYRLNVTRFPTFLDHFISQGNQIDIGRGLYGGRLIPQAVVQKQTADLVAAYRDINAQGALVAGIGLHIPDSASRRWTAVHPAWRHALISNSIQLPYNYTAPLAQMHAVQDTITHSILPKLEVLTPHGAAYVNGGDFQQADWKTVFYGDNYDALRAVKNRYDPLHNFYAITAVGSEEYTAQPDGRLCRSSG